MVKGFAFFASLSLLGAAFAAEVIGTTVHSDAMNRDIPVNVVLPSGYAESTNRYPVVYMLHGAGGTCQTFLAKEYAPRVLEAADTHRYIIVMPDGSPDSWWFDSPEDPSFRFETHVYAEVVPFVDARYRTWADRAHRAILGGSMGGHGAGWIGLRHKDLFGAIGIIFGGVDFRPFPDNWHLKDRLGPYSEHSQRWLEHTVLNEAGTLKNGEVDLISIVGTGDFFLKGNRALHQLLADNKVEHVYVEIRGADEVHSTHHRAFAVMALRTMFPYMNRFFTEGKGRL